MDNLRERGRRVAIPGIVLGLAATGFAFAPSFADAATSSDGRASAVDGNVTTCAQIGFPSATQVGADGGHDASNANVSGDVVANSGVIAGEPGEGQELDVTLENSAFVVLAVVIKAGDAYNLYTNPGVLPPSLGPPQHYIGPLVGAGNVPNISHWFVCYGTAPPPTTGTTTAPTTTTAPPTLAADIVTVQPRLTG